MIKSSPAAAPAKHGLKYLLLDLLAGVSVLALLTKALLDHGHNITWFAPACPAHEPGCVIHKVGESVEVHDTPLVYSFLAKVDRAYRDADGEVRYDLRAKLDGERFASVSPESLRPAPEHWQFNTPALCDFGESLGSKLAPCVILSRFPGGMEYLVSVDVGGLPGYHQMGIERLRRVANATSVDRLPEANFDVATLIEEENESSKSEHIRMGHIVEAMSRDGRYAYPARIVSYVKSSQPTKYDLDHMITGARLPGVYSEYLRPYDVYKYGTQAFCRTSPTVPPMIERRRGYEEKMAPCTVLSSAEGEDGGVSYKVSYLNEEHAWVQEEMSYSRIQRILSMR